MPNTLDALQRLGDCVAQWMARGVALWRASLWAFFAASVSALPVLLLGGIAALSSVQSFAWDGLVVRGGVVFIAVSLTGSVAVDYYVGPQPPFLAKWAEGVLLVLLPVLCVILATLLFTAYELDGGALDMNVASAASVALIVIAAVTCTATKYVEYMAASSEVD